MTPESRELTNFGRQSIEKGSKSFAFASFFFSESERTGAWLLYSWCRHCDDQIDEAPNAAVALERLQDLETETRRALETDLPLSHRAFEGLRLVHRNFGVPLKYPLDLLRGMRMDVEGREFETLAELEDYCYCVAGVVGLMMCHVMGVSSTAALGHAVSLGSAMQLTNISRDVADDLALGRIYFPRAWLRDLNLTTETFRTPAGRKHWAALSQRLLAVAEERYQHGQAGLQFLSPRAAYTIAIAANVYRGIGLKVLKRREQAWDQRVYVTLPEKIWIATKLSFKYIFQFLVSISPKGSVQKWQPKPINVIWGEP